MSSVSETAGEKAAGITRAICGGDLAHNYDKLAATILQLCEQAERADLLDRALRVVCFEGCPPGREFEQACLRRTCWKCRRDWALAEAEREAKGGETHGQ